MLVEGFWNRYGLAPFVSLLMLMLIKGVRSGNGFAPFVSGVSGNFYVN